MKREWQVGNNWPFAKPVIVATPAELAILTEFAITCADLLLKILNEFRNNCGSLILDKSRLLFSRRQATGLVEMLIVRESRLQLLNVCYSWTYNYWTKLLRSSPIHSYERCSVEHEAKNTWLFGHALASVLPHGFRNVRPNSHWRLRRILGLC